MSEGIVKFAPADASCRHHDFFVLLLVALEDLVRVLDFEGLLLERLILFLLFLVYLSYGVLVPLSDVLNYRGHLALLELLYQTFYRVQGG